MESRDPVLGREGRHLEIVSGPDHQYLLLNVLTHDYLKVSGRAYDLLSKSWGRSVGDAVQRLTVEDGFEPTQLLSFFEKIVRLGFVLPDSAGRDAAVPRRVQEVWLHVTDRCNLACPMCYFQSDRGPSVDRCLPPDKMRRVIEIIAATGPQQVVVSGGEPLMRIDLQELLGELKERGQRVWLLTNGTLLTPSVARWLAGCVDRVSVSLDGTTAAVHEKVRGAGTFSAVLRGIKSLQGEGFTRIGIVPTIRRDNLTEIFDLDRFAETLHVTVDSRCLFTARGSAAFCKDDYEVSMDDLIRAANAEMRRRLRRGDDFRKAPACAQTITDFVQPQLRRCGAGQEKLSIDVDGSLYPCQLLHEREFHLGNILSFQDLNQLIRGPHALQVARFTADRADNVGACRACDVRRFCGGGCVVSNVSEGLPLDQCPSYCSAIQTSYRVAVWEWRSNCSNVENLVRFLEKVRQGESDARASSQAP